MSKWVGESQLGHEDKVKVTFIQNLGFVFLETDSLKSRKTEC